MKRMVAEAKGKGTVPELRAEGRRFGTVPGMKGFVWGITLLAVAALSIVGCGGGGGGPTTPPTGGATTTTISGKVSLSSTVAAKPAMLAQKTTKASMKARMMKAGKAGYSPEASSQLEKVLAAAGISYNPAFLAAATVELYDADKPEWLYPVATAVTSSLSANEGEFTLSTLINASKNNNAYTDGDAIPVGKYTLIASKYDVNYGKLFVAVQAIVKEYSGAVTGNDLVAQDSDAIPSIVSMFGLPKNADGSFGSTTTEVPANAAVQVTFSLAMARLTILDAVSIVDSSGTTVPGTWKISPDLITATFYPTNNLSTGTVYTVTVTGGTSAKAAKNVYGKPIASTVKGYFKTKTTLDITAPAAIRLRPTSEEKDNMSITTPIRIGSDEPLDINTIAVTSSPSIGAKPSVQFIGKYSDKSPQYPYIYEIIPAEPLKLATTYTIAVSGGKDLAGNSMSDLSFQFTTESTTTGVTGATGTAEADAQTAVKAVFGKWIQGMNDQNTTALTTFMAGDFYWLNDPSKGPSSDDLNRDGRLDLQEFTTMLGSWFKQLKMCNATIGGTISDITVSASTANITFSITVSSSSTMSECREMSPPGTLYAELQNINSAWIMTRGADFPIPSAISKLAIITATSPVNGVQLPDPATDPTSKTPTFKWTGATWTDASGTAKSFATYAVILIDNKAPWHETGWVGLVDGSGIAADAAATLQFSPTSTGSVLVLPRGDAFGFKNNIAEIQAGGDYTWAVLGFKTKTVSDFSLGVADPLKDLGGSSIASYFTVAGVYKELKVTVTDAAGAVVPFSEWIGGYDAGSAKSVILTITTPNPSATTANVNVWGYTSQQLSASFTGGVATVGINLSNKNNWVQVCDNWDSTNWQCNGFSKEFNIFTTGGAVPKIEITSVSGKNCNLQTTTLTGPDSWNNYISPDVCTVDISGTVDASITGTLNLNVWNDMGNGQYSKQMTLAGTSFTFTNVPVYKGRNWVEIADQNWNNHNGIGVETAAGSTYTPPISVTSVKDAAETALTASFSDYWGAEYDAGSSTSMTITGTMANVSASCQPGSQCSGWGWSPDRMNWPTGGSITSSPFTIMVTLYNGWNYIGISDSQNNHYEVRIYTAGGSKYVAHAITSVMDSSGVALTPDPSGTYNAGASCSVTIAGTTPNSGQVNLYLYNSTTGISESQTGQTTGAISPYSYTITQNIYNGTNDISVNDAKWNWQGIRVNSTCTATPVVFDVTGVAPATWSPTLWQWDAGTASQVTITGTAAAGKQITAYISAGTYYNTVTTTATTTGFSLLVDIYKGYNYISVTDGMNWEYLTVYTAGGTTVASPFEITSVTPASGDTGTVGTSSDGYNYYNATATTITISGTSTTTSCTNCITWYGGGTSGTASITSGAFSVNVTLWYGSNYVDLYGPNGTWDGIYIYTTGGSNAPKKIVYITSPANNSTQSGSITVSGTVDTAKFTPTYIYGYVYDYSTYQWKYYYWDGITDAATIASWGYLPITYSSGAFSFDATVAAGNITYISVYAYDANWYSHGHEIYVNSTGYNEYYWKPGSKPSAKAAIAKAHKAEFVKKMMSNKPKAREKGR